MRINRTIVVDKEIYEEFLRVCRELIINTDREIYIVEVKTTLDEEKYERAIKQIIQRAKSLMKENGKKEIKGVIIARYVLRKINHTNEVEIKEGKKHLGKIKIDIFTYDPKQGKYTIITKGEEKNDRYE